MLEGLGDHVELYAVYHVLAYVKFVQVFQRLWLFLYAVYSVLAYAKSVVVFIYPILAYVKFHRLFQLPSCSLYVVCLALFSPICLVQILTFLYVSSLPLWEYTVLSFLTERRGHIRKPLA